MADEMHRFIWNQGEVREDVVESTEDNAAAAANLIVDVERAQSMSRAEVLQGLDMIKQRVLEADTWPPATI